MKRTIAVIGTALLLVGAGAGAASAGEGHAYGKVTKECVAALGLSSVGSAIQAGRDSHPDAKMTAKTIAESAHCAS
jgi:hypothetical protein